MFKKNFILLVLLFNLAFLPLPVQAIQPQSSAVDTAPRAYFSPNGGIQDKIISRINLCRKSIKIAIYSFTSGDIAEALERAKNRGVDIKIVADKSQSRGKDSEIPHLISKGITVKILKGKGRGIMHNKFAIFDDKEVITGSYNWTENAERNNYENAVFINDSETAEKFSREFDLLHSK